MSHVSLGYPLLKAEDLIAKWENHADDLKSAMNPEGRTPVTALSRAAAFRSCARDLAELLVRAPVPGWQAIESAPKDGSWVLVLTDRPRLVRWNSGCFEGDAHWCLGDEFVGGACYPGIPTLWMPLPPCPGSGAAEPQQENPK